MKKLSLFIVVLFVLSSAFVMAEDNGQGLVVSGSVSISFGDDDLSADPGASFSSAKSAAIASLTASSENEKVMAGLTVDLTPAITMTEGDDPLDTTDLDNAAYYDALIDAYNWYLGNDADITAAVDWTVATGIYNVTNGNGAAIKADVEAGTDSDDITWDQNLIDDTQEAFINAVAAIQSALNTDANNIAGLSGIYDVSDGRGSAYEDDLTAAEDESLQDIQDLWDDFSDSVLGEDTDDSWAASYPVKNAYLKVMGVAGVVDLMFEVNGKAIAVGSMVTSDATAADDANIGFSAALSEGVVEGVSASVLLTAGGGAAAVDNDEETYEFEEAAADPTVWGTLVSVGYATDMFGVDAALGLEDVSDTSVMLFSVMPSVSLTDLYGLSLMGEVNGVTGDDLGLGYAAKLSANVMGIAPSVSFWGKNEFFGGDDSYALDGSDDVTTDSGLVAEFNSIDDVAAMALDVAVAADLTELMGQKLVSVNGGYAMMLGDDYDESGWNAGLGLDFSEVLAMPLTAGFDISKWAEEDLVWAGNLGYTFSETMVISAVLEQPEAEVLSYTVSATVSF